MKNEPVTPPLELAPAVRSVFSGGRAGGATEVRELLRSLLLAELLAPGEELWLVSPWVTDVLVLDNRAGAFDAAGPGWGPRQVRLSDVLVELLASGRVHVVTRPDDHNEAFIRTLTDTAEAAGRVGRLRVVRRDTLHHKGLLGTDYYLSGSMNFTVNGLEVLEEAVTLQTDPAAIADARLALRDRYPSGERNQ